jgi:hypothetical protein
MENTFSAACHHTVANSLGDKQQKNNNNGD